VEQSSPNLKCLCREKLFDDKGSLVGPLLREKVAALHPLFVRVLSLLPPNSQSPRSFRRECQPGHPWPTDATLGIRFACQLPLRRDRVRRRSLQPSFSWNPAWSCNQSQPSHGFTIRGRLKHAFGTNRSSATIAKGGSYDELRFKWVANDGRRVLDLGRIDFGKRRPRQILVFRQEQCTRV
jgi:hypothetical protein